MLRICLILSTVLVPVLAAPSIPGNMLRICLILSAVLVSALPSPRLAPHYDVIVCGATPAGVLAAAAAAGEGASTLLLDPRNILGGAISGGLCTTDIGTTTAVLGGRTASFFSRVGKAYGLSHPIYSFEPKIATSVFESFLSNVTVSLSSRITSLTMSATPSGPRITGAMLADGRTVNATVFVDASYEGFLLPLSSVSFVYGRESNTTFNESMGGVLPPIHPVWTQDKPFVAQHQLHPSPDPNTTWANGTVLPLLTAPTGVAVGRGDNSTQSYAFRTTLTTNTSNMLQPWPKPDRYDPLQFEFVRRAILFNNLTSFVSVTGTGGALPNNKYDNNDHTYGQFPGLSFPYPEAVASNDWAAQQAVWDAHRDAYLGLFYFLSTDPSLPPGFASGSREIGLPLDEHTSTGHFPGALYIREALRMQSDYIFTQDAVENGVDQPDSCGMGSYSVDIMHHFRYPTGDPTNPVLEEGGLQGPSFLNKTIPPFQIPWRALIPKRGEATNLIVPVALSSSHVGFNAVRLEPTWMVLGESAGVAAAQAVQVGVDVQALSVPALQARLLALGQVLRL